jgi:hypothetical protein
MKLNIRRSYSPIEDIDLNGRVVSDLSMSKAALELPAAVTFLTAASGTFGRVAAAKLSQVLGVKRK